MQWDVAVQECEMVNLDWRAIYLALERRGVTPLRVVLVTGFLVSVVSVGWAGAQPDRNLDALCLVKPLGQAFGDERNFAPLHAPPESFSCPLRAVPRSSG